MHDDARVIPYAQGQNQFHKKLLASHTPVEAYATLLIACLHFGQHAKCCSVACKYFEIMLAANAACCMASKLLAANAARCKPHAPDLFFTKPENRHVKHYASTVFELS